MKPVHIAYIGGYGRSGSTLLEWLMCCHDAVWGLGEAGRLSIESLKRDSQCTCGAAVRDCPVWQALCEDGMDTRNWSHLDIIERVLRPLPAEARVIVDGSKTASHPMFFPFLARRRFGKRFVMVHITRHPCGVLWSMLKGNNKKMEAKIAEKGNLLLRMTKLCRMLYGWSSANLSALIFGVLYRDSYLRVSYEELATDPGPVISRVLQRFDLHDVDIDRAPIAANRHQLFGNRMRLSGNLHVNLDESWKHSLKWHYRFVCMVITAPMRFLLRI